MDNNKCYWKKVEKVESWYIAGSGIKWWSHIEEQFDSYSKM